MSIDRNKRDFESALENLTDLIGAPAREYLSDVIVENIETVESEYIHLRDDIEELMEEVSDLQDKLSHATEI